MISYIKYLWTHACCGTGSIKYFRFRLLFRSMTYREFKDAQLWIEAARRSRMKSSGDGLVLTIPTAHINGSEYWDALKSTDMYKRKLAYSEDYITLYNADFYRLKMK